MLPLLSLVLLLVCALAASGQSQTRAELIDQEHEAKQKLLEPDVQTKLEKRLLFIKDARLIERIAVGYAGLSGRLGGMPTGSGFALGPDYFRDDLLRGELQLEAERRRRSAVGTTPSSEYPPLLLCVTNCSGPRPWSTIIPRSPAIRN